MASHKHYINNLAKAKELQKTGVLWYEDGNGNDMKGVTWEPMLISPTVWRFFVWVEDDNPNEDYSPTIEDDVCST